ncbi:hypothetical protein N9V74_02035 [Alteromonas sp.]|nr:hypothetical protein [Alteromonas sp.]
MAQKFIPHGSLDVFIEDRILSVKPNYAPNGEMVGEFQLQATEYINMLKGKPWASISYLQGDSIFPIDAIGKIEDNLKYMKHCGLVSVAVIIYNAESPIVVEQF